MKFYIGFEKSIRKKLFYRWDLLTFFVFGMTNMYASFDGRQILMMLHRLKTTTKEKNANSRSRRSFWLMIPLAWLVSPYLSHRTHKTVVLHSHPFTCIKPDPFAFSWVLKKQLDINTHKNLYLLAIYNLFLLNYCFNDFNGEFISMKTRRWICNLLILTINFLTNRIFWNKNER